MASPSETPSFGYVLSVIAGDKPGIVAGLSEGILRLGGNIESCNQAVLSGFFTLMMTLRFETDFEPDVLAAELLKERGVEECRIFCSRTSALPVRPVPESSVFILTAFGADRPGVVRVLARALADKGVNITELYAEKEGDGRFVLIGQVEVDPKDDPRTLLLDLEEIGAEYGYTVKLQHKNIFVATNQLRRPSL